MAPFRARVLACALALTVWGALPAETHAFKIGYKGIPVVVDDFPPVHEALTAAAVAHLCRAMGVAELNASRLGRALFVRSVARCDDLSFKLDMGTWRNQMQSSPIADLLLGARYPDLREMTGVDADKQDVTVVKFDDEVQIDSYRLYPQFHGQLSKYHNVWGGDMQLGLMHLRTFTRAVLYEVAALMLAYDAGTSPRNELVAANAMLDHDTNNTLDGLLYDVRWHSILLGSLFHSIEDGFSHDPLRILDVENNRLVNAGLFYGQFKNSEGKTVGITSLYPEIDPGLSATMAALRGMAPIVEYSGAAPLNVADIPQSSDVAGVSQANWFEHNGKRYQSGHLGTTLAMYAVSEFLSLLALAVDHPEDPARIEAALTAYLDKYLSIDLEATAGYTPTRTQDIAAVDPEYAELPWYNYHFVDLWKQSGLDDRVKDGKQAFILPWTSRDSMGDLLKPANIEPHFVIVPADEARYDATRRIYYVQRDTFTLFTSWYRTEESQILSTRLDPTTFFVDGKVQEREIELDSPNTQGLDKVYASAFIPAGYRACFTSDSGTEGAPQKARTAAFDTAHPIHRCFYGTEEGRWAHINFHFRKGTRIKLLPIDVDGDFVPFLRGIVDDVYADNCPFVANADQADADQDGVGDVCQACPFEPCDSDGSDSGVSNGGDSDPGASGAPNGEGMGEPAGPKGATRAKTSSGCSVTTQTAPSDLNFARALVALLFAFSVIRGTSRDRRRRRCACHRRTPEVSSRARSPLARRRW